MIGNGGSYRPNSSIMIVSICSRTKNTGHGDSHYSKNESILSLISPDSQEYLLEKRDEVRNALPKVPWQSINVSEIRMNRNLKRGLDFGGQFEGEYLPAIVRYEGTFYREGGMGPARKDIIYKSGHHHLILSGLYGLVTPSEPLQLYSCPVEYESIKVQNIWIEGNALTSILIDYIKNNGITHVFDLSARRMYRDLIDWDRVRRWTGSFVLHCFADDVAGNAALPVFGKFAANYLFPAPEEELKNLQTDSNLEFDWGAFIFRKIPFPPEGFAKEPVISMMEDDRSEEGRRKRIEYLKSKVDEFERTLRRFLDHMLNESRPDYWNSFDSLYRKRAEDEMAKHLKKHPMIHPDDVSTIDFLYLPDYKRLIKQNWDIFKPIFRDEGEVKKHIDNIIELRNPISHSNPTHKSIQMIGEGSILWFEETMKQYLERQ